LHTRISEQLSDDIRRLAEDLRVPTSNLVRNVLEEVFTVVESVSGDVGDLFEDVVQEAESARDRIRRRRRGRTRRGASGKPGKSWEDVAEAEIRRDEAGEASKAGSRGPSAEPPVFPEIIGWQPLVLNQTQNCGDCGVSLQRGCRAFVGLTETGLSRVTLCRDCLQGR
jgi:hypothetical protein